MSCLIFDCNKVRHSNCIPSSEKEKDCSHAKYTFQASVVCVHCSRNNDAADRVWLSVLGLIMAEAAEPPSQLNPSVTPELDAVVARAMAKSPAHPYDEREISGRRHIPGAIGTGA